VDVRKKYKVVCLSDYVAKVVVHWLSNFCTLFILRLDLHAIDIVYQIEKIGKCEMHTLVSLDNNVRRMQF